MLHYVWDKYLSLSQILLVDSITQRLGARLASEPFLLTWKLVIQSLMKDNWIYHDEVFNRSVTMVGPIIHADENEFKRGRSVIPSVSCTKLSREQRDTIWSLQPTPTRATRYYLILATNSHENSAYLILVTNSHKSSEMPSDPYTKLSRVQYDIIWCKSQEMVESITISEP